MRGEWCEVINDAGFAAACAEVVGIAGKVGNDVGLHIVGQTEIEPSQLAAQPVIGKPHFAVGVVGSLLVDHIPDEAIVGGRLYAEAPTAVDATEPDESPCHSVHKCKGTNKRAENQRKTCFSLFSRAKVHSARPKVRISERKTKGKLVFLCFPERK